jgi:octanoyl-[GcvH]:protein N-octanoyltransferase
MSGSKGVIRPLNLVRERFAGRAALDTAVSRAFLLGAAAGAVPETLRLYRAEDVLAFSVADRARAGFAAATDAARARGFEPILRLAGGRAAVFTEETLAFAWCMPDADAREGIEARFRFAAELWRETFRRLGVDARVGEVPGEYCPGAYSVNARGRIKLMGVGQRIVRGAAHVGGVVVVRDSERVRTAIEPVYRALGYPFDPAAIGSLEDELPGIIRSQVAAAFETVLAERFDVKEADVPEAVLARAHGLAEAHAPS